jgi:phosphoenolpyruvate carboxylase
VAGRLAGEGALERDAQRHRPARPGGRGGAIIGPEALGIYIISMTDGVSDVLEVELLQKLAGSSLPIAPLFETLDDLERAPEVLTELFALPGAGRPTST